MNRVLLRCLIVATSAASLLTGCWTFNETVYPTTRVGALPSGKSVSLNVTGFQALVTTYAAYHEYRTMYVPGGWGYRHYHPGYFETVPTVAYLPQNQMSDLFLRRAKDTLEQAGFAIAAPTPDWTVDVAFSGPVVTNADTTKALCWMIGTIFFCDYGAATWTARLRVRDNRTGKPVLTRDYSQRYETNVFGLIPLFSISAANELTFSHMQNWCLNALTDRVVQDVADHFSK